MPGDGRTRRRRASIGSLKDMDPQAERVALDFIEMDRRACLVTVGGEDGRKSAEQHLLALVEIGLIRRWQDQPGQGAAVIVA